MGFISRLFKKKKKPASLLQAVEASPGPNIYSDAALDAPAAVDGEQHDIHHHEARVLKIGKQPYVIGLTWVHDVADDKTTAELRRDLIKSHKNPVGVLVQTDFGVSLGKVEAAQPKFAIGKPSLVAKVAAAVGDQNVILIEPIDRGLFWMCIILDGLPNAYADTVGDLESLQNDAEFIKSTAKEGMQYNELPQGSLAGLLKSKTRSVNVGRLSLVPVKQLFQLVLVVAVLAGGLFGFDAWQEYERKETARRAQAHAQAQAAQRKAQEAAAREAKIKEVLSSLANPSAGQAIAAWREAIRDYPAKGAGWEAESLQCKPESCSIVFRRQNGDLPALKAIAPAVSVTSMETPNSASVDVPITIRKHEVPPQAPLFDEAAKQSVLGLIHLAGNAKVTMKFDTPKNDSLGFASGTWQASGTRAYEIYDMGKLIDRIGFGSAIQVTSLEARFASGQITNWKMGGTSVFRSK